MKKKVILSLLLAATFLGTSAVTYAEETNPMTDIAYNEDGESTHLLDVVGSTEGEKKPVIVEVHGGSYIGGDKGLNTAHSEFYAENGFVVVNTNYTTMKGTGFDKVVQDLTQVLNWVEANADTYGFDLDNVFMSGDSAGGFFVNLEANVLTQEDLQEYYGVTPPSFDVKAFVLSCPGADIRAFAEALDGGEGMPAKIAETMGADVIGNEDVVDHADLYTIFDAETYPDVYIMTTPDDVILYNETKAFHEFLEENEVAHEYKEYESDENTLEHVFNIGHTEWKESIQANSDIVAYLNSKIAE